MWGHLFIWHLGITLITGGHAIWTVLNVLLQFNLCINFINIAKIRTSQTNWAFAWDVLTKFSVIHDFTTFFVIDTQTSLALKIIRIKQIFHEIMQLRWWFEYLSTIGTWLGPLFMPSLYALSAEPLLTSVALQWLIHHIRTADTNELLIDCLTFVLGLEVRRLNKNLSHIWRLY